MKRAYRGYHAYDYLKPGEDYRAFALAEWNWAGENVLPLEAADEERLQNLLRDSIYVALHEHPCYFPADIFKCRAYRRAGREMCAYDALAASNIDCLFDNLMKGSPGITSKSGWKWSDVVADLGMRLCDIAHQDFLIHCRNVEDIRRAKREGKIAWVACLECASPIENELDRLDLLYGYGVRMMGIAYSESNMLGSGLEEMRDGGLTAFGRQAVERMNRLGMLIDASHCGARTALDAIEASAAPIMLTHCGARSLWNSRKLFPDDVLKACAGRGGVVGIEAAPHTTMTATHRTHDIDSVMEHFEYVADLVGINHVSFGIDSLYGDHVALRRACAAGLSAQFIQNPDCEQREIAFVRGLENPTEASWNVPRWLVHHGYADEDIRKVIGGNALRVLEEVWR